MNKTNIVIVGGGIVGLLTAIAVKSLNKDISVCIFEEEIYNRQLREPLILTPISRQLLHKIKLFDKFNFNEGKYHVHKLVNKKYGLSFEIPDTIVIDYNYFILILLRIVINNRIGIITNKEIMDYNFDKKYVATKVNKIFYDVLIIADSNAYYNSDNSAVTSIDEDINEYEFKIHTEPITFNKVSDSAIYVGRSGNFKDPIINVNHSFEIMSAICGAESANENNMNGYYKNMKSLEEDIIAAEILKRKKQDFRFINDIISGKKNYSDFINKR